MVNIKQKKMVMTSNGLIQVHAVLEISYVLETQITVLEYSSVLELQSGSVENYWRWLCIRSISLIVC